VIETHTTELPPPGLVPAGFFRRCPATLIDMITYCGICALLAYPVSRDLDWLLAWTDPTAFLNTLLEPELIAHAAGILGLWIALWWCYFAVGWGLVGTTIGKRICGLRIVDHKGRRPIGLSRAFLRLAAYSISSVTFGMGHILIVLRPDHRALHDILAGTWVVRTSAKGPPGAPPDDEDTEAEKYIPSS